MQAKAISTTTKSENFNEPSQDWMVAHALGVAATLSGVSKVIGGDPLRVIIAPNGNDQAPQATGGKLARAADGKLWVLTLEAKTNAEIPWSVRFR